jgi:hypothetical protein
MPPMHCETFWTPQTNCVRCAALECGDAASSTDMWRYLRTLGRKRFKLHLLEARATFLIQNRLHLLEAKVRNLFRVTFSHSKCIKNACYDKSGPGNLNSLTCGGGQTYFRTSSVRSTKLCASDDSLRPPAWAARDGFLQLACRLPSRRPVPGSSRIPPLVSVSYLS